ncbi:MAG: hypothetical protein LBV41_02370 [Cytophagaceae bacterium]|nr:hypothetical protein [Cytophagaceae bacterium]
MLQYRTAMDGMAINSIPTALLAVDNKYLKHGTHYVDEWQRWVCRECKRTEKVVRQK